MVNGNYNTGTITLSKDKLLKKEFIERAIIRKMNPRLYFLGLFHCYDTEGASSFTYFRDDESAEDDITKGVMTEPLPVTEMSKLTKLDVSTISKQTGDTYTFGYEIKYTDEKMRENGFIDEVLRAYDRASYGMARKINLDTFHILDENAGATPITLNDGTWDNSNQINDDFIDMQYSFEDQEGWDYTLTDAFLNTKNYRELDKFYSALNPQGFNPADVEGVAVENTKKAVSAGTLYGIDRNIKPITMYKYVNPKHSTLTPKEAKGLNSLINVHVSKEDDYPFVNKIQMWCEIGFAIKHPKAILKQTGI